MSAIGVDVANAIANQIRVKSGIEARSLGAAATPKDLLPLGDPLTLLIELLKIYQKL